MGVQQHPYQRRRPVESGLYHQQRVVRTQCHVLRTYQLTSNLPNDDERDLHRGVTRRMADGLYGRHANPYQRLPRNAPKSGPPSTGQTGKTRPLPQTGEMLVRTTTNGVPGRGTGERYNPNGSSEGQRSGRLAPTKNSTRCESLPRFYRLLSILRAQLLHHCTTPYRPHKESNPLSLGPTATTSLPNAKRPHVRSPGAKATRL